MYRHKNYAVSGVEFRAFPIGRKARIAARAAQPKPECVAIEDIRQMSASERFDYEIRREMKKHLATTPAAAVLATTSATR
jgi:hypothetical protein